MKIKHSEVFAVIVATGLCLGTVALASGMDSRIEASAAKSYVFQTYLKDDTVVVNSRDGAVILTGSVADESHKSLAVETVANLPGVKSVDDQLVFKGEQKAENSDGWIGMKVKTALLFHHNINAFKTQVDVKEGVVTLSGEAASQAQKDLAGEYAKDVSGVKDVKNEMTLAKIEDKSPQTLSEKIDDASITAQVKVSLLSHHSTSAVKTKVATSEGIVTLSGIAQNEAEKALVSKLVNDINGVLKVVNNMTIVEPIALNK